MKYSLLFLMLCGCYTPTEKQLILSALDQPSNPPGVIQPPITMQTKFASKCPYCGTLNISKSCLPSGSRIQEVTITNMPPVIQTKTNIMMTTWSIAYVCPRCEMPHSDQRFQATPDTQSIRLPIFGQ